MNVIFPQQFDLFRDRLMVGQQPLELFILVRIQVPEPKRNVAHCATFFVVFMLYFAPYEDGASP
jgi:hypothetical protein